MKTLLVPVDFSAVSINALSFAAELARRASARLIVMNILQKGEEEQDANYHLGAVKTNLEKTFGPELNCESIVIRGDLVTTLQKTIAVQQPDLIVMGTKGASGLKKDLNRQQYRKGHCQYHRASACDPGSSAV